MNETYKMKIAGLERELKKFSVNDKLDIAAFILFGDVDVTVAAAKELLEKVPDFDVILTPEAKSIPLAYEMSKQCKIPYIVARKGVKVYMENPISVSVKSITTDHVQQLFIGSDEAKLIKNKRILVVDDVISTGESLEAVQKLAVAAGGNIVASCAVLAEGDAADRTDIIFLEKLPLFFK